MFRSELVLRQLGHLNVKSTEMLVVFAAVVDY
jgi:hypothetical protein